MVPCSGDHTVKIICHRTGQCLKVLSGHRRTPWVVRFHPMQPHIVASGSLDYEASSASPCPTAELTAPEGARTIALHLQDPVPDLSAIIATIAEVALGVSAQVRVWDVEIGKCLVCFNFGRPIASLAFHAAGCFLAVASGHKVRPCRHVEN